MPTPNLQPNGWFPSGIPWSWYIGRAEGSANLDVALSYEGGNQVTGCVDVPFTINTTPAFADLLGINTLSTLSVGETYVQTGTVSVGFPSITALENTKVLQAGMSVTGDGVPDGTTILTIDSPTTLTMSANATSTVSGGTYTFATIPPTGLGLHRQPPMQHPYFPHLYCSRIISAKPMQFVRKQFFPSGFNAPFYTWWRITALFTQPKWNRTLNDTDLLRLFGTPAQEWQRFTTYTYRPSLETIARLAATFKWAEGPGKGQPFNSPAMMALAKADIILIWHRVPKFNAVFSSATGRPTNIESAIGKLNNATFMGYPKGVLKLNPPEIMDLEDPVPWTQIGINPSQGQTSIMCDVAYPFSFWDPPQGSTTRGHNLFPYGDAKTNGDGSWYLATLDGSTSATKGLYNYTDFTKLFQPVG